MAIKKLSSREFRQDSTGAKRAASRGPVYITNHGRPTHVLLTFEEYRRLTKDLLAKPKSAESAL